MEDRKGYYRYLRMVIEQIRIITEVISLLSSRKIQNIRKNNNSENNYRNITGRRIDGFLERPIM